MQWNILDARGEPAMLAGVDDPTWVYFVHSFAPEAGPGVVATCDYGGTSWPLWSGTTSGPRSSTRRSPGGRAGDPGQLPGLGSRMMDLYPAIDLRGGRCVRLHQGDYDQETDYGDDPVGRARRFAADGAPWIHVVDLDAARTGSR